MVVSDDRDFGRLAVAGMQPMIGILFLRPGHVRPQFTIGTIQAVLDAQLQVDPPFIIVAERSNDDVKIRVRQG